MDHVLKMHLFMYVLMVHVIKAISHVSVSDLSLESDILSLIYFDVSTVVLLHSLSVIASDLSLVSENWNRPECLHSGYLHKCPEGNCVSDDSKCCEYFFIYQEMSENLQHTYKLVIHSHYSYKYHLFSVRPCGFAFLQYNFSTPCVGYSVKCARHYTDCREFIQHSLPAIVQYILV